MPISEYELFTRLNRIEYKLDLILNTLTKKDETPEYLEDEDENDEKPKNFRRKPTEL